MNEPLIEFKTSRRGGYTKAPTGPMMGSAELGYAVEQALRYRHPPVVFVDEAQHLARIASGRRLSDQLDVIKSIANRTETVHVLLGTYELLAFRNLSAQLSRRSVDLHFQRYRADSAEDRQVFRGVLLTFQKQLPLPKPETDLVATWEFLYERSVGCVGILKEWLMRACVRAIKHGAVVLSREHLERTALSISQCEKILAESREGETRLNDHDGRPRLRTLLGIEPQARGGSAAERDKSAPSGRRKRGRPGQRAPRRDPTTRGSGGLCITAKFTTLGNPSRPDVTRRSYLYPLTPMGVGTAAVESFTGYIARLAAAHAVETGVLVKHELRPRIPCTRGVWAGRVRENLPEYHFYVSAHTLNGVGARARLWVSLLEQLTCVARLDLLTALPWARAISCVHLLRPSRSVVPRLLWRRTLLCGFCA